MPKRRSHDAAFKLAYMSQPWKVRHRDDHSELQAYSEAGGNFETVLTVHGAPNCDAKKMAGFVLNIINDVVLNESIMLNAMHTMRDFLIENDFEPKVEKPVVDLVERIKRTYGLK